MKTTLLCAGILFISTIGCTQDVTEQQVPSLIVNNFKSEFPNARDIEWQPEGKLLSVEFETKHNKDHEVWYNDAGVVVKRKTALDKKELPVEIRNSINKNFHTKYHIDNVDLIEEDSTTKYVVDLESKQEDWEVIFAPDGQIISKAID